MHYLFKRKTGVLPVAISGLLTSSIVHADAVTNALTKGKAYGDIRLRYETVDQNNNLKDADALTIRSRVGYNSASVSGFSASLELEDSRTVAGFDSYNNTNGSKPEYSVIADPETTELDQAFLQYQSDSLTSRLGRQVLTYDNHRFVGHVGWRQDRQTFDGISFIYSPLKELTVNYAYLEQRNRIFAEEKDIDSKDHLLNVIYNTPIGKVTGYSYILEEDTDAGLGFDTYGIRFSGETKGTATGCVKILYTVEYTTQKKSSKGTADKEADYYSIEGGIAANEMTVKLGYEVLGADDGGYGFTTPLATLHKFNGWADQFLATPNEGLVDTYISISGKLVGGTWELIYHDFSADDGSAVSDDFGNELDVSYTKAFGKNYSAGVKYAAYSADDAANNGAKSFVDTDKVWVWLGAKF